MTTTTKLTTASTVGAIVAERPHSSRVFERLSIDYCCGGRATLDQACQKKRLDAATVLTLLLSEPAAQVSEPKQNWQKSSLTDLADHIEQTHHAYLRAELPRLETMVRKVAAVHGKHHSWLLELDSVFAGFSASMQSHLLKEEQVLFPLIRQFEARQGLSQSNNGMNIENPIAVMEHEHADAGQSLERMRRLSHDYQPPANACATFRATLDGLAKLEADTHEHVHKENSILFPRAVDLANHQAE